MGVREFLWDFPSIILGIYNPDIQLVGSQEAEGEVGALNNLVGIIDKVIAWSLIGEIGLERVSITI